MSLDEPTYRKDGYHWNGYAWVPNDRDTPSERPQPHNLAQLDEVETFVELVDEEPPNQDEAPR